MKTTRQILLHLLVWLASAGMGGEAWAQPAEAPKPPPALRVTADNFVRAETDRYFGNIASYAFGRLHHYRDFLPLDKVPVVRINRDTLYSVGVFDLDAGPVTVTLPDAGNRYLSLVAYNEDHYASAAIDRPGRYTFSREQLGTRYAVLGVRILFDPADPADRPQVHALQDAIRTQQAARGRFEVPAWDPVSLKRLRDALIELGRTLPDSRGMFGSREQVVPLRHLIGSAIAWGGNHEKDTLYLNVTPDRNDGVTVHRMHLTGVPVDGFWSISVYDEAGWFKPNPYGAYTINNLTAKRSAEGSIDIQFGGCDGKIPNCLPTMAGWNYMVRLYRPRAEILNGSWMFPVAAPVADDLRAIARDAYIYGFPVVDHYRIQHSYFVDKGGSEYKGAWNEVHNTARVYTPDDRAIQSPSSDTPYSFIGADLRAEPLVISVPAVESGRYYSAQFVDAYTHNFAFVGSRSTGNGAGRYLLAGPDWSGEKPAGVTAVIRSETEFAYVMFRTQLFGPQDIENVKQVQAGYRVQTLSSYLRQPDVKVAAIDFPRPLSGDDERKSLEFFKLLNVLLQYCPPHPSEQALMQRLARIGVGAGKPFDAQALSPETRAALEAGMAEAWQALGGLDKRLASGEVTSRDLFGSRERLRNNYLYRMRAAVGGIYGVDAEEALYPIYYVDATGRKLDGTGQGYTMRFAPGQLPPVNAFWSLTLYELPARALVRNPLNRYLINSPMLPGLKRDADGGITLYVQHESPGKELESNWLPAPAGPFFMGMRVYWPKAEALSGEWKRPALQPAAAGDTKGANR